MRAEDKEFNSGSRNVEFPERAEEFTKSAAPDPKKPDKNQEEKREKTKQKRLLRVFLTAAVGVTVLSGAVKLPGSSKQPSSINSKELREILSTVETYVENEQYEELIELALDDDVVAVLDEKLGEYNWYGFDGAIVFPIVEGQSYDFEGMVFQLSDLIEGYVGSFENGTINGPIIGYRLDPWPWGPECEFYYFGMDGAQLEREVSYVEFYGSRNNRSLNEDLIWDQYSVEGNVNEKWVFEGTITAHSSSDIPADVVHDIYFNVDEYGCLIEDEHVTRDDEAGAETDKIRIYTDNGVTFWTSGELRFRSVYNEEYEMISLWYIRQLPEILNCDYYIADDTDEIPDTQPDGTSDAQTEQVETEAAEDSEAPEVGTEVPDDPSADTDADADAGEAAEADADAAGDDAAADNQTSDTGEEGYLLYTIGKPFVWYSSEDGLIQYGYDEVITDEEPLTISKFVQDSNGVVYGAVNGYLYIAAVYLSETPVETYVEYEPIGVVGMVAFGESKDIIVTSESHIYKDPNLTDGELVEVELSDFTSVGDTLFAQEICTYNGVTYKVVYFDRTRYLIDAWEDVEP